MELGAIITIIGILVSIGTYYAGVKRGERQERKRREHKMQLEQERRDRDLVSKVADEYVNMARRRYDLGPSALARINNLDLLDSDKLIREAIHEMHVRSGTDPWEGQAQHVEDVDLVRFFRYVRENNIDFFGTTVEKVVGQVKAEQESSPESTA